MGGLEDKLNAAFYRITCPPSTELGEYHLGMVPAGRAMFIKRHLAECPHCSRELNELEGYLDLLSPDLEHALGDRIRILIARLIPEDATGVGMEPAFAVRGESGGLYTYEAGAAQVTVEIQEDPGAPGFKSLVGLIVGIDSAGVEAHLWRDEERIATTVVDDLGNFTLSGLDPGAYELILSGPEIEIHIQELTL